MRNPLARVVLCLAALAASAPPLLAGPPPTWKPPARKDYDVTVDKVLYEVGYAHLDTQWNWTYVDTIRDYIPKTMNNNFTLFGKYPDYTFSFTGSNRYQMMKDYYPASYAKVKQYIDQGRWHVAGSAVEENDVNVPSAESIIRGVLYGNHFFRREFGTESVDYCLPDCFGFPASLPSILSYCGLKGFSTQKLTWGSAVGIPFTVGRWYGPDGKYITAALDPGSYTSTIGSDQSNSTSELNRINALGNSSGTFVDYRYFGTGDTGGSPTDGSAQWEQSSVRGTGPITVVSAPADWMFRDLNATLTARMPSYTGDLLLTQHSAGSITSQAYMKRWNRKNEMLADSAERAAVMADWLGAEKYPLGFMDETWRFILGGQFHDILPGTSVPKAYEYSWNDEVVALNRSASVLANSAGAVIRAMDTNASGIPVVVYNPLSTPRQDVAEATVRFPSAPAAVRVYGPNGQETPSQVQSITGNTVKVLFLAQPPPLGFIVYDVRPADQPSQVSTGLSVTANTLENQRYRVTLNADGDVSEIYDKTNSRQLLSAPIQLQFKYDFPSQWPAWNIDWSDQSQPPTGVVSGPATVRIVENGPARVALEVTRSARSSRFVEVIRLAAGANRVEFDNTIDWNERQTTLKAAFPLAVTNDLATYNLGLGTIKRGTNTPEKYEVPSHEWFDLTDASNSYGVTVLEDCKFGSDKPDDHTLRLTLIRTPGANSYTEQATQDVGRHHVLFGVAGHPYGPLNTLTGWEASRLNQPLVAFQAEPHEGSLGKSFGFLSVDTPQVAITAVKKAQDSDEIIVRLQELRGGPITAHVSTTSTIISAREVNGQEDPVGPASFSGRVLTVSMGAYSPKSFAIRLAPPAAPLKAPTARPLMLPYDIEAAGYDATPVAKGMDGLGATYHAELFPATLDMGGIPFRMARIAPGARTALSCQGQNIPLPTGAFRKLYILAAAANGDTPVTFRVGSQPVSLTVQDWKGFIGQWDNRIWTLPAGAPPDTPKLDGGIYGLQAAYIKRDPVAWVATHRHTATGGNNYYAYGYIFEYAIDLPAGTHSLTLPTAPGVAIFAITAAAGTNDTAQPAQYLYDAFEAPDVPPAMTPVPGSFADTVSVRLFPSLYDTVATLRYTLDGTDPTAASPAYTAPISISQAATLKARAFRPDGSAGPVAAGFYDVNDRTAPTIASVNAVAGSRLIQVTFSEPVLASTATVASNYAIAGLAVNSASLSADGASVNLSVYPAPASGTIYGLLVNGVKDNSPAGNTLNMVLAYNFTPAVPIITVSGGASASSPNVNPPGFSVTVTGAPAPTSSPHGNALSFNGTSDAITVANAPTLSPTAGITVMAWVNANNWNGNRRILQKGNTDNQYRLLAEWNVFKFDLTGVGTLTCPLPTAGEWHHIAGTYDGKMMKLYVDGVVVAEAASTAPIATTSDALNFGTKNPSAPSGDHFAGLLADIRLYNQALGQSHIRAFAGL